LLELTALGAVNVDEQMAGSFYLIFLSVASEPNLTGCLHARRAFVCIWKTAMEFYIQYLTVLQVHAFTNDVMSLMFTQLPIPD
jgi:hypothetical protein